MHSLIKKSLLLLLALAALAAIWSCNNSDAEADQYLTWNLSDAYKSYDTVSIKLVDAHDSTLVYEVVWNAGIPDPAHFPKYKLTVAKDKDFTIQIRAYNAEHELVLSKNVDVVGSKSQPSVVLMPDVRLLGLSASPGTLTPAFDPNRSAYSVQVGEDVSSITLTATPVDADNVLTLGQTVAAWGQGKTQDLGTGVNVIVVTVATKDGKLAKNYELTVTRGRVPLPEEVTSVALQDRSLTLFTGDGPTAQKATVVPAGALLQWTSLNEDIVRVDGSGRLTPVAPGTAKVIVKAGNFADTADVTVKKDAIVLDVGQNVAVKPGAEVTFNITLSQEHGTVVSFKYDLDGDNVTDNPTDTTLAPNPTNAPVTLTFKHTFALAGTFVAHFYAKDSEGNITTLTRTIKVSDASFLVAIVYPGRDTLVNVTPILIRYEVNGTLLTRSKVLVDGLNTVTIDTGSGADKGSDTVMITLDTVPPAAPNVAGTTPTTSLKPTWTWTDGVGGNGTFRVRLDSADLSAAPSITVKTYTPAAPLLTGEHTLYVQERDEAGNWSASGSFKVTIQAGDGTPPNPPKVTGTSPTGTAPKWSWSTGGGGGSGTFRYKLGDSTLAGATDTHDTTYTLIEAPVSGKTYTLYVAEKDSAGNWSASTGKAIVYDVTKPTVTIVSPQYSGTYLTKAATVALSGTASGPNTIVKVSYKINAVAAADAVFDKGAWSIASVPALEGSATLVTIIATDNLGNTGEASLSVVRDNTPPSAPTITASPATPTNVNKGSWAWSAGTDGTTGSGLNGSYQYSLDGGTTWKGTTAILVNDLPLVEGNNSFSVQEQDLAGNWSLSASKTVVADFTGPKLAITSPAAGAALASIHATLTGTTSDAGTSVQSVIVTGQVSGSGTAVITTGTWTTGDLVLKSGQDTLIVTATDALGNATKQTLFLTVTVATPQVQITYPVRGFATNQDTVTLKYKVDGGAEKSQVVSLTKEGFNLLTATSPKNEAGLAGTDTLSILRDVTIPNAPTVTPAKATTNADPSWTFTTGGDNAGGSGVISNWYYKITGAVTTTGYVTSPTFTLAGAADGVYNFVVQQQDKAGNWGNYSVLNAVTVDKTKPVVSVTSPADGFVTNQPSVQLVCNVGGTNNPAVATPLTIDGANPVTCTSTDAAGNTGTKTINVYYRPKVFFVKAGATGANDGSSWASAFTTIRQAMAKAGNGKQIWVAGGSYDQDPGDTGLVMKTGLYFYGGFPKAGTANSPADRTFGAQDTTFLNGDQFNTIMSFSGVGDIIVDGFSFKQISSVTAVSVGNSSAITLRNLQFVPPSPGGVPTAIEAANSTYTVDNCLFSGYKTDYYIFNSNNSNLTMNNSTFTGNQFSGESDNAWIYLDGPTLSFTNLKLLDNPATGGPTYRDMKYVSTTGQMTFTNCTFRATNKDPSLVVNSSSSTPVTYNGITWITP